MDKLLLERIKVWCEEIEIYPGHGQIVIKIMNGHVYIVEPTPRFMIDEKNKKEEK